MLIYADAGNLAYKAAPLLDITDSEFMRLRRNEQVSSLFQPRQ